MATTKEFYIVHKNLLESIKHRLCVTFKVEPKHTFEAQVEDYLVRLCHTTEDGRTVIMCLPFDVMDRIMDWWGALSNTDMEDFHGSE